MTISVELERASRVSSASYRGLIVASPLARSRLGAKVWERAWRRLERRARGTTQIRLHGHSVRVNIAHPYPAFMRRWPSYNSPLVRVVQMVHESSGRPVVLVDVGASVGDTALLVTERCPGMLEEIWCIEGDDTFAAMLEENVRDLSGVQVLHAMASDGTAAPALVRTHAGSAGPRGPRGIAASPLDELVAGARTVDVLKIDTDGFDGRVLQGSARILSEHAPIVQFEWHPALYRAAEVPVELPFDVLRNAGYEAFVWFDKFGRFAQTEHGSSNEALADRAQWCMEGDTPAPDWHYDVVALPCGHEHDSRTLELEPPRPIRTAGR
jgi:FkbM family methyltransferase